MRAVCFRALGVVVGLALLLAQHSAFAQASAADKASAEALFDQARKLMAEGKHAEACPKFAASQKLDPGLGTLLNLALCYKASGQTASAWSTYREAAALARAAGQADREELARTEAAGLEPSLTQMVIAVPAAVQDPGFEVRRDGSLVPRELWNVPVPVDPGPHTIEARTPGKSQFLRQVVAAGAGQVLRVDVPEPSAEPAPPPPTTNPAPAAPLPASPTANRRSGSGQRVLGVALAGAGVIGIGVGTFFGVQMKSKDDDAREICKDPTLACTLSDVTAHDALKDEAKSARAVLYAGVGVGSAALIAGAVLFFAAPEPTPNAHAVLRPRAHVDRDGALLELGGTW